MNTSSDADPAWEPRSGPVSALDELRVLVVDDEEVVAESHALMLEQHGITAAYVTTGSDALSFLDEHDVDAVVSDYQMPERDGLELLEHIRARYPTLPFILFTGRGSEEIASEAISKGVTDYIQKGGQEKYDLLENRIRNAVERARAQRSLEETRSRFEALTQNTNFAVVTVDANDRIRYASDTVRDMFGYAPDELLGDSLTRLIPERLVDAHREGFQRYLDTGEKHLDWGWVELSAVRSDGTEIPVGVSFGERQTDDDHYFTGLIRDITEQKARERKLEERAKKFEAVFENATDSIFIIDPRSKTISDVNPKACEMLGYDREELRGLDIEAIHPNDHQELLEFASSLLEEDGEGYFETECHTKAGETIPAEVAGSTIDVDGDPHVLALVRPTE